MSVVVPDNRVTVVTDLDLILNDELVNLSPVLSEIRTQIVNRIFIIIKHEENFPLVRHATSSYAILRPTSLPNST